MIEFKRSENLQPVDFIFGIRSDARPSDPGPEPREPDTPDIRNADSVLALAVYRALKFRKRRYRVPPVPYDVGLKLQRLFYQLIDIRKAREVSPELLDAYDRAVCGIRSVARELLIPLGWRRWLWRLHVRPDPLKSATEGELGVVLDFLLRCRMTAPVRLQIAADQPREST